MKYTNNLTDEDKSNLSDDDYDLIINDINNDLDFIEISKMHEFDYECMKKEILEKNPDFFQKTDNIIDIYSNPNVYDFRKYKISRTENSLETLTPKQFIENLISELDEEKYNFLSVINSRKRIFSKIVDSIDNKIQENISEIKKNKGGGFFIDIQHLLAFAILIMAIIINIISVNTLFKDDFINQVFGIFLVFACLTVWVNKYFYNKNLNEEYDIQSWYNIKLFSLAFSLLSSVSFLIIILNSTALLELYKSELKLTVTTLFIIMIIPVLRVATKISCNPIHFDKTYGNRVNKWGKHGYK